MHLSFVVIISFFLASCSSTIYLVRHAERADASADAVLSGKGLQRALALRDSMNNKPLNAIFATQFRRTQQTAQPAADAKKMIISRYTAAGSDSLILELIRKKKKKYLVTGHSNTVPAMLRKIGLSPSMKDIPDNDFDNLFIVSIRWFFGKTISLEESTYGMVSP